jgi:hypothetical protein
MGVRTFPFGKELESVEIESERIDIGMGDDEVADLHGLVVVLEFESVITYPINVRWLLWKKSEKEWPEADLVPDNYKKQSGVVAVGQFVNSFIGAPTAAMAATVPAMNQFWFPRPITIIRPMQFLVKANTWYHVFRIGGLVYYEKRRVSNADLEALMIQDHG